MRGVTRAGSGLADCDTVSSGSADVLHAIGHPAQQVEPRCPPSVLSSSGRSVSFAGQVERVERNGHRLLL